MIGSTQIATVIDKTFKVNTLEPNGVNVDLGSGVKGFLHISRLLGQTPADRANTLDGLMFGSQVEVDVVSQTKIDGEVGYRVNQWSVVHRARRQAAEILLADQTAVEGKVVRLGENFAIIKLNEDAEGLLHVSRVIGDSEEERNVNFAATTVGSTVRVVVSEIVEVKGRVRVRLGQVDA